MATKRSDITFSGTTAVDVITQVASVGPAAPWVPTVPGRWRIEANDLVSLYSDVNAKYGLNTIQGQFADPPLDGELVVYYHRTAPYNANGFNIILGVAAIPPVSGQSIGIGWACQVFPNSCHIHRFNGDFGADPFASITDPLSTDNWVGGDPGNVDLVIRLRWTRAGSPGAYATDFLVTVTRADNGVEVYNQAARDALTSYPGNAGPGLPFLGSAVYYNMASFANPISRVEFWDASGTAPFAAGVPTLVGVTEDEVTISLSAPTGGSGSNTVAWEWSTTNFEVGDAGTLLADTGLTLVHAPPKLPPGIYWDQAEAASVINFYRAVCTDTGTGEVLRSDPIGAALKWPSIGLVFLGDSTWANDLASSYATDAIKAHLEVMLGPRDVDVINRAVNGTAWRHWVPVGYVLPEGTVVQAADTHLPAAVAMGKAAGAKHYPIFLGHNSAARSNLAPDVAMMDAIIAYIRSEDPGASIHLMGMTYGKPARHALEAGNQATYTPALTAAQAIRADNVHVFSGAKSTWPLVCNNVGPYTIDGLHPSAAGADAIALQQAAEIYANIKIAELGLGGGGGGGVVAVPRIGRRRIR